MDLYPGERDNSIGIDQSFTIIKYHELWKEIRFQKNIRQSNELFSLPLVQVFSTCIRPIYVILPLTNFGKKNYCLCWNFIIHRYQINLFNDLETASWCSTRCLLLFFDRWLTYLLLSFFDTWLTYLYIWMETTGLSHLTWNNEHIVLLFIYS